MKEGTNKIFSKTILGFKTTYPTCVTGILDPSEKNTNWFVIGKHELNTSRVHVTWFEATETIKNQV